MVIRVIALITAILLSLLLVALLVIPESQRLMSAAFLTLLIVGMFFTIIDNKSSQKHGDP